MRTALADRFGRLADRCIDILRHLRYRKDADRYSKREIDVCWRVAKRVPRVAKAAKQANLKQ